MDQFEYLTRDQLISLVRTLGAGGPAPGSPDGLPVFGERARRDFEASESPMRIFDHETLRFLAVNDAAVKFYGYSRAEFLRMTLRETRHPDEHAAQLASLNESSGYFRFGPPRRQIKRSGEIAVVEVITQDMLYEGRKARLTLTMDITPRLRMQEALSQRQREFESLAENLPDLIARFDRGGRYLYVNAAVERTTEHDRSQIVGRTQRELGQPADVVALFEASLNGVFATGEPHKFEFRFPHRDGERLFEAYHVPEIDGQGAISSVLCVARDITERKAAEENLRRQKDLFAAIVDNLPVGVFIRDAETLRYILRNRFLAKTFGFPIDDATGKTAHEVIPGDHADVAIATDRRALETGEMVDIPEMETLARAGGLRWQHIRKVPLYHPDGRPWLIVGITEDITERKQAEKLLRETNEYLRSVIESSRDCVKVLDLEGRLLSMNGGGRALLEIDDLDRFLNTDWLDFWSGPDREAARAALDEARGGGAGNFEGYCPTRNGAPKWWDVSVSPILDAGGRPARLLAVSRDITRRKREQETQRRLAAIVNHSMDAVISQDLEGVIRTWNPAAEGLFGYRVEEAVGKPVMMLIPAERREEDALVLARIREGVPVEPYESIRRCKDGTTVEVSVSLSPVRDDAGRIVGASRIARDITERKKSELAVLRGAALARLLESLARTANEAVTPEEAMVACLERICRYGRWVIGRVTLFEQGSPEATPGRSVWYAPERARYAEFIEFTSGRVHNLTGSFVGRVLRERVAVWIDDLSKRESGPRNELAIKLGLWSGLAFPIVVNGNVVAIIEVLGDKPRAQDPVIMGAAQSLASLLARIVERERAHQAKAALAAIVESSQDAIISRSLDGTLLTWNRAAERLFGYTAEEIVGRNISVIIPAEIQHETAARQKLIHQGLDVPGRETVRITKDGRRIHVFTSPAPIRDSSGRICGTSTIIRDITERKRAELAIRRGDELARLHVSLARAADGAATPEAAMLACLERICSFGNWVVGRVALYDGSSTAQQARPRSFWHLPDRGRFAPFVDLSDSRTYTRTGSFVGRVLRERTAVWIEDLQREVAFSRRAVAVEVGLRSGFAFPIIVRGEVVATMEAFSSELRTEDPLTMGAVQAIASQLARIVERELTHRANAVRAAIVESSQDAVVSRGLDGRILTWNRAAERLFGYTADEIMGKDLEILYPRELRSEMAHRRKLAEQGIPLPPYETVRIAKDGRRVHVTTSPGIIRDSSGAICGVSAIMRDNTARMQAEQALRESEERFRQLAENIKLVFWINSRKGDRMVYVSPAYEEIWGRSRASLYRDPRSWMSPIHPEDVPIVRAGQAKMARGEPTDVEYRIIRPDGTLRWIKDRSYAMEHGREAPLVCGIAEDITEARVAEQTRLTQAIHQRDALVREVHHRIKNNLQGVIGLLRQKMRQIPAHAANIEEAIAQLQSVAVVYGLQGTRVDGQVDLAEMVEAVCASTESLIGGRVDRKFERDSLRPARISGSEAVSIAVALNELVFNALKHDPAQAGKKRAQIKLSASRDSVEIRITNRGRLPRAFHFAKGRGVGNGLELVRTLLASPGASVDIGSDRNKVQVVLKLGQPLLAVGRTVNAGKPENGGANKEKAATARTGR